MSDKNNSQKDKEREPLFVGSYIRDNVVSEYEKLADASLAIFSALKNRRNKGNKN